MKPKKKEEGSTKKITLFKFIYPKIVIKGLVVIKGIQKDGSSKKTILDSMFITAPAPEFYYHDSEEVDDRRVSYD